MNQIELKALAKINLGLDVLGRRENGYHDVRMVMQSIYLYDEVRIEKAEPERDLSDFESEFSCLQEKVTSRTKPRNF